MILIGNCKDKLKEIQDNSIQTCITSPPYWGLRDYGDPAQIGLEQSPQDYVQQLVEVFREVWRCLKDDGTLWLNLGDSYSGSGKGPAGNLGTNHNERHMENKHSAIVPNGLKPKDLVGIPWLVAFALQADGWYLRQDIIWSKPNPMPESVTDRCTKSHEYVFLLSKFKQYYFDNY
jgi:DNA modification methylase